MHFLYNLLLYLALPFALLRLLWRSRRRPAYRERWRERLGYYTEPDLRAGVWIHAVSVGEVQAAQPLISHLLERYPGAGVMVTTTTPTGSARLRALFEDRVRHVYTPYDLVRVERFLDRGAPRLVLVMETEIWPNMLAECQRRGIPVVLANARLSARSAKGYARVGGFARETFARFTLIAAQAQPDAQRFIDLGAPPERVKITGSIKFDLRLPASLQDQAEVMRRFWSCGRPVWVAASTHEGEEEPLLGVQRQIRAQPAPCPAGPGPAAPGSVRPAWPPWYTGGARTWPGAAPGSPVGRGYGGLSRRHHGGVADLPRRRGRRLHRRQPGPGRRSQPAGGGRGRGPGRHRPPCFNFATITRLMVEEGAAVQVQDAAGLTRQLCAWLGDAAERARVGENGLRVMVENRGALPRLLALLDGLLGESGPGRV